MTDDDSPAKSRRIQLCRMFVLCLPFLVLPLHVSTQAVASASDSANGSILSNLHSDKRVVQSGRWFLVREFDIQFAVRGSQQTYCGELSTTDATEANDLIDSEGHPVQLAEKGKDLEITLGNGRHIKAHRLTPDRCPRS
jgi:hypothetical protein